MFLLITVELVYWKYWRELYYYISFMQVSKVRFIREGWVFVFLFFFNCILLLIKENW